MNSITAGEPEKTIGNLINVFQGISTFHSHYKIRGEYNGRTIIFSFDRNPASRTILKKIGVPIEQSRFCFVCKDGKKITPFKVKVIFPKDTIDDTFDEMDRIISKMNAEGIYPYYKICNLHSPVQRLQICDSLERITFMSAGKEAAESEIISSKRDLDPSKQIVLEKGTIAFIDVLSSANKKSLKEMNCSNIEKVVNRKPSRYLNESFPKI